MGKFSHDDGDKKAKPIYRHIMPESVDIDAYMKGLEQIYRAADKGDGFFNLHGKHDGKLSRTELRDAFEARYNMPISAKQEEALERIIPKEGINIDAALQKARKQLEKADLNHDGIYDAKDLPNPPATHHTQK